MDHRIKSTNPFQSNRDNRQLIQMNHAMDQHCIQYFGIHFIVYRHVFSPLLCTAWKTFTPRLLQEVSEGTDFLEIGCGCGITGLYLHLKKTFRSLFLTDISLDAIRNTAENIKRLGIRNTTVMQSDVFDALPAHLRFDTIYWNPPWCLIDDAYIYQDDLERGTFNPGYRYLEKYIQGVKQFLKPQGRIFLGFGNSGDDELLEKIVRNAGYHLHKLVQQQKEGHPDVEFILFELL